MLIPWVMAFQAYDLYYASIASQGLGNTKQKGRLKQTSPASNLIIGEHPNGTLKIFKGKKRPMKKIKLPLVPSSARILSNYNHKMSEQGRIKLHNENTNSYFCSKFGCEFVSKCSKEFDVHYEKCSRLALGKSANETNLYPSSIPLENDKNSSLIMASSTGSPTAESTNTALVGEIHNTKSSKTVMNDELLRNEDDILKYSVDVSKIKLICDVNPCATPNSDHGATTNEKFPGEISKRQNLKTSKMKCKTCDKSYKRIKSMQKHILKCPGKQATNLYPRATSQPPFIAAEEKPTNTNICLICRLEFRYNIALKKHMEKLHYKTTSTWNGTEYVPIVMISLKSQKNINHKQCDIKTKEKQSISAINRPRGTVKMQEHEESKNTKHNGEENTPSDDESLVKAPIFFDKNESEYGLEERPISNNISCSENPNDNQIGAHSVRSEMFLLGFDDELRPVSTYVPSNELTDSDPGIFSTFADKIIPSKPIGQKNVIDNTSSFDQRMTKILKSTVRAIFNDRLLKISQKSHCRKRKPYTLVAKTYLNVGINNISTTEMQNSKETIKSIVDIARSEEQQIIEAALITSIQSLSIDEGKTKWRLARDATNQLLDMFETKFAMNHHEERRRLLALQYNCIDRSAMGKIHIPEKKICRTKVIFCIISNKGQGLILFYNGPILYKNLQY